MINSIIEIKDKKNIYALIIKKKRRFIKNGVDFLTKDHDLLQLGFIKHKKNHYIKPHIHLKKPRIINYCTEVLLIEKGRVKIKFFNKRKFFKYKQAFYFRYFFNSEYNWFKQNV